MSITGIGNGYSRNVYENSYVSQNNSEAKRAETKNTSSAYQTEAASYRATEGISDYYSYLQKNYDCVKNGNVAISGAYLKECANNPQKAKELEENLSYYKEGYESGLKNAQANAKAIGARVIDYSESWNIDSKGNVTVVASTTVTSDNGVKGWKELAEERKEKLEERREKLKAQEEKLEAREAQKEKLEKKMSEVKKSERSGDYDSMPHLSFDSYGIMNDFEKIMSELGGGLVSDDLVTKDYSQDSVDALKARFEKEDKTVTNAFDNYTNKMAAAYQLMKDRIEQKYSSLDRQKEYYTAEDGSAQELTQEKELEMLDKAYETHSRFMAVSTQIWGGLQDFKAETVYFSAGKETEMETSAKENGAIGEQAYNAFMSARNEKNGELLKKQTGNLNNFHLDLGISSSARGILNGIWGYYANIKR